MQEFLRLYGIDTVIKFHHFDHFEVPDRTSSVFTVGIGIGIYEGFQAGAK